MNTLAVQFDDNGRCSQCFLIVVSELKFPACCLQELPTDNEVFRRQRLMWFGSKREIGAVFSVFSI
jgi:hypothetical protein